MLALGSLVHGFSDGGASAVVKARMNTVTDQPARSPGDNAPHPPGGVLGRALGSVASVAICFFVALGICLSQNFSRNSLELALAFDSSHYLDSAQKLFTLWRHILNHGLGSFGVHQLVPIGNQLLLDGPVLPLLGSVVMLFTGRMLTPQDVPLFIGLQSFLAACCAGALCLVACRFTGSLRCGLLAGLVWALYPPAIIGAGRFMTEILTALLLVCLVLANSFILEATRLRLAGCAALQVLSGFLTGCIWLLRGALAPATVLINLAAFGFIGTAARRALFVAAVLAGLSAALVPWLAFTKLSVGHAYLIPQRAPVLNVVIGLDPDTDGWGTTTPPAPLQSIYSDQDGAIPTVLAIASAHPGETLSLVLRKATRLWEFPWNDYQQRFLRFAPAAAHTWWHDSVVIAGLLGLLIFLCTGIHRSTAVSCRFIGTAGALAILGHGVYVLFAANTRYGFTAMPFLVLFAVYAVYRLAQRRVLIAPLAAVCSTAALIAVCRAGTLQFLHASGVADPAIALSLELAVCVALLAGAFLSADSTMSALAPVDGHRLMPRAILAGSAILSLAVVVATQTTDRKTREWASVIRPGQAAVRRIALRQPKPADTAPAWAFVVFDGDRGSALARLSVNGTVIQGRARPLHSLKAKESAEDYYTLFAGLLRVPSERLRQWRCLPLPPSLFSNCDTATISFAPAAGESATLYGDFPGWGGSFALPSLIYFSPTRLVHRPSALEGRTPMILRPDRAATCSLRTASGTSTDLSTKPGCQFGQYRLFILTGFSLGKDGLPDLTAPGNRLL